MRTEAGAGMNPVRLPPQAKRVARSPVLRAFDFAFAGILYATRTQRNMRIHLVVGALVLIATLYLRLERAYVALIVLAIALVLALELVNTAVEAVVDLMTVAHHPLAKIAKDAAAGAVLVAAMAAVIVGYLAFYEGINHAGAQVAAAVASVPRNLALVCLTVVGIATIFVKALAGRHGRPLQGGAISGHAALAFAGATLIALLAGSLLVAALAFLLATLVAQSRVEGGIHSFGEVLVGALLGVCVSSAIYAVTRA